MLSRSVASEIGLRLIVRGANKRSAGRTGSSVGLRVGGSKTGMFAGGNGVDALDSKHKRVEFRPDQNLYDSVLFLNIQYDIRPESSVLSRSTSA